MSLQHFFVRLISPRVTFPGDITEREKELMGAHAGYMAGQFAEGRVLVYGPVMATSGAFGMAVLEVVDEAAARALVEADPCVGGGLMRYEVSAMRVAGAQGLHTRRAGGDAGGAH